MTEFITLKNKNSKTLIQDVLMYPLKINKDNSGVLIETLRIDWPQIYSKDRKFFMQYFSVTPPRVARDEDLWHYHPNQEDRFLVAHGEVVVAVADNREDSRTKGVLNLFYMQSQTDPYILLIPKKTLHGFMVVSKDEAVLLNFPTKLYDPREEGRVHHKEVNISLDGELFTWEKIRQSFK